MGASKRDDVELNALIVWCNLCFDALDEPGALIFGTPDADGNSRKWHVCDMCYETKLLPILAVVPQPVGLELRP